MMATDRPRVEIKVILLVVPVAFCFLAVFGFCKLHGDHLNQMISRRSLRDTNKTSTPPKTVFPSNYHATGRLFLPHNNIIEPFEVWFSKDLERSRIDYYYGTDKTYQRADLGKYGVTFKVVPMYTESRGNYIGCWKLEGHKGWPIIPQPIVPNMSYFQFAGEEVYMGTYTTKWEYRYMAFDLLNAHTLLVSKLDPFRPIRYEMKGYDSLLASYYDNYVLEYISFEEWKPEAEQFELPKDQWCYNWSHSLDSHIVSNPMGEFISHGEDTVEDIYNSYKLHHNKIYDSKHEHVKRKHIFRHNMRYIRSINRQNLSYKLAPNHLVDLADEDYDRHEGLKEDTNTDSKGGVPLKSHHEEYSNTSVVLKTIDVPDELDWRDYGAVNSVRGQGICGSCYALGAVEAVEGAYFMKTGRLLELSAQQLVDCSWGSGNHGCRGGWYNKALSWIYLHGVAKAKDYGPYLAQEGTCITKGLHERININAFAFVPKYNNSALKRAVAKYGPACVSINQKPLSLKFYSWGIYDDPECDNSSTLHTVLVIGYGKENGVPYWLVKNSWSSSWGIDGYIKLAWKGNTCGVTKNPVVALMKHTSFQFPVKENILYVNPLQPDSMGRKVHGKHRPHGNIDDSSLSNSSPVDSKTKIKPHETPLQNASKRGESVTPLIADRTFKIKSLNSKVEETYVATYLGYKSNDENFGNGEESTSHKKTFLSRGGQSKQNRNPNKEQATEYTPFSHSYNTVKPSTLEQEIRKGSSMNLLVSKFSGKTDINPLSTSSKNNAGNMKTLTGIPSLELSGAQTERRMTANPTKIPRKSSLHQTPTSFQLSFTPSLPQKPVRPFSGKLQDIYDQLERVISTSLKKLKKKRRLKRKG